MAKLKYIDKQTNVNSSGIRLIAWATSFCTLSNQSFQEIVGIIETPREKGLEYSKRWLQKQVIKNNPKDNVHSVWIENCEWR